MIEEAGTKLLAAIEAMMSEIRGLREDLSRDRGASEVLERRRLADAVRQKRLRSRESNVTESLSRDSNVSQSRDNHVTSQVVALDLSSSKDLDLKQLQKKEIGTSRDDNVTDAVRDLRRRTWHSYSAEFFKRYKTTPIRNAKVNGQLRELVKRLGEEAIPVAAFYLRHPDRQYVKSSHSFGPLLEHAEGLRTQWARDAPVTGTQANQVERTAANADGWAALLKGGGNVG